MSHINKTLALLTQDDSTIQFAYKDNIFHPIRDLTAAESVFENIERRTYGFTNPIVVDGYSHDDFYAAAKESKAVVGLYLMNRAVVIIPHRSKRRICYQRNCRGNR